MKKNSIIFLVCSVILVCQINAHAEKMRLAVLDLKGKGVSKMVSYAVSDLVRSEMIRTGLFTVVERAQMDEILKEQGLQQTGCTDSSCAVQVGKILSAKKILIGEINRLRTAYVITIRIVDVEKGVSEFSANERAESEDVLDRSSKAITKKLAANIVEGNREFFVFKSPAGYYTRSIIPGLGQVYAGEKMKGYFFLGGFAVAAGLTVYSGLQYNTAKNDYLDVPRGSDQSVFDEKFDQKKKAGLQFLIMGGLTSLIYIANWTDVLFITNPDFGSVASDRKETPSIFASAYFHEKRYRERFVEMGVRLCF